MNQFNTTLARCGYFLSLLTALLLPGISHTQELQKIGHLSYPSPVSLAGCWHYVDQQGGEWALVGTSIGLSIVDLRTPSAPVERFTVPGIMNGWREVKTWDGYAYVGSEALLSGITIVDLNQLPDTIRWKVWRGDGANDSLIVKSHTVEAEAGYLYVFGGIGTINGAVIASLSDPWNPHIVGLYTDQYVHDGYIRGDTLWTSEIYKGWFGVVDIADRSNPVLLTTQPTPGAFNHNSGLNDAGTVLFTTDEKSSAPLGAFDVSDIDNIRLLDTYLPSRKPQGEVHNVRVLHDFLINPSYRGQLTIVDASRPDNLIETAWDSLGNSLVWDADPYFPSGIIAATARQEGLYVYQKPAYHHAAWLEGHTYDGSTGNLLAGVKVFVLNTPNADTTGANGIFRTGAADSGQFTITAEKPGYAPVSLPGVVLTSGQVKQLDINLFPVLETGEADAPAPVQVVPSVFTDKFMVHIPQHSKFSDKQLTCRLADISGKLICEKNGNKGQDISFEGLSDLPSGVCFLLISGPNEEKYGVRLFKK